METKKRWGINKKATVGTVIGTLILVVLCCLAGSLIFKRAIEKQYNEKGYILGEIILNEIDHDKVAQYTKTWKQDDYYKKMARYLHFIRESSGVAYIYIVVPYEDGTMRYVYDSSTFIGDSDPIAASFDEIWTAYTEGVRPESYLVRRSKKYGYLTSSCLPVRDSSGNVVALLLIDTSMDVILSTLRSFVLNMVLISLVLLLIFCLSNWYSILKNLLNPIMVLGKNVQKFASGKAEIDTSIEDIQTGDELEDLAASVLQMEKDIVHYIDNIQAITAEKERISAELDVATRIQAEMLPSVFPPFPDRREFEIYATMTPAKEVGGDFYDFFFIDKDHIAMVMADVSGKGVPAALFMAKAKTLIRARATSGRGDLSPSRILTDVNAQLCENNAEDYFVTVWLAIISLSTGKGLAINAGHEYPVVRKDDRNYELLIYRHCPALAISQELEFQEHSFEMKPGDSFFVYTDGIPEAANADMELFGNTRMVRALNKDPEASAQKLLKNVADDIAEFVGDAPQFDDITMLAFKYFG